MSSTIPLTMDTLVRVGLIAHELWPKLTHNCRIDIVPFSSTIRSFAVYPRHQSYPQISNWEPEEITLMTFDELRIERFKLIDPMSHFREWLMGASESSDTLIIMPVERNQGHRQ